MSSKPAYLLIALFASAAVGAHYVGITDWLSLDAFSDNRDGLLAWDLERPFASAADLLAYVGLVALSLLALVLVCTTHRQQAVRRLGRGTIGLLFVGGLSATVPLCAKGAVHTASYDRFLSLYESMLAERLAPSRRNGITYMGVDYEAWRNDPRHAQARQVLLSTDPSAFRAKSELLAFWINAYNFLTIDLIVRENERKSIRNLGGFLQTAWQRHRWIIQGREYSLDDIEHGIIRPMGEARIHFAINCAAISCPDLRPEPYRAAALDRQLEEQVALTFENASKGLRWDGPRNLYITKVMDWFRQDFAGGDLHAWLVPYLRDAIGEDVKIRFLHYDWTLNSQ